MLDDPKAELGTWHGKWLFECPPKSFRAVLVWKDVDGTVTRRETFEDSQTAENSLLMAWNQNVVMLSVERR